MINNESMWVIGAAVSASTFVFYGSFYLGQIWHKLQTLRTDVDRHDKTLGEMLHDRRGSGRG